MAFTATTEWDVRSTGSDSNGGGFDTSLSGTDYSQQNAAQVAYTDMVIDATTATKFTSALNPVTAAHVGNVINVTGGTGFTIQRVMILSQAAGVATCDKSLGTLSSTGGTGNLGGALLTIGTANGLAVDSSTVHIKSATYTLTASLAIAVANMTWKGFGSTHGDGGTKPLITTATNSVDLIKTSSNGGIQTFDNLSLSNTAGTRGNGLLQITAHGTTQWWVIRACLLDGFSNGINSDNAGAHFDVSNIAVINSEVKNSVTNGATTNTGRLHVEGCYFHANATDILAAASVTVVMLDRSIFAVATGDSLNLNGVSVILSQCTVAGAAGKGLWPSTSTLSIILNNNIFYGNQYGVFLNSAFLAATGSALSGRNNAFGNNSTADYHNWPGSPGDFTLSSDPFTNSGAGDYSLNATTGGGAACRNGAFPGAFPGGLSTGYPDAGAVQTTGAPGAAGGGSYTWIG